MKNWDDEEVKALFDEVERCKVQNFPTKKSFEIHAKKYGRKPNSVRNYYYHEVENLQKDVKRCKKIDIDIKKHKKIHFLPFDSEQENSLYAQIETLKKQGLSVRAACEKISNGDLVLMTRLQNKYQNIKAKILRKDNVIMFKQNRLSENDINSLFLGIVKLIQKTAVEEKDRQIVKLKNEFEMIKSENLRLSSRLDRLLSNKNAALKNHLGKKKLEKVFEK